MSTTDLGELVRARLAAKISAGKRLSKAEVEYFQLINPPVQHSSVVKTRSTTKGETGIEVKTYHVDPFEAARLNDEIFAQQRAKWPMQDGTVGAPMREQS